MSVAHLGDCVVMTTLVFSQALLNSMHEITPPVKLGELKPQSAQQERKKKFSIYNTHSSPACAGPVHGKWQERTLGHLDCSKINRVLLWRTARASLFKQNKKGQCFARCDIG